MYSKVASQDSSQEAHKLRERRILEHLPQVKLIAARIAERLPDSVSVDDLISAGTLGLINAVDQFNPNLDIKLKTYAEHKIRGAILDSLRSIDWAPRNKRRKAKQIEAAITEMEKKLQRAPEEPEVAAQLGVSLEEYRRWLVETRGLNLAPLEQASSGGGEGSDVLRFISDESEEWPLQQLERSELRRLLIETIERLPEVERTIITLYYRRELTLRQIAAVVELHETRVSQLKSQAILRMRASIRSRWPGASEPRR